jgi:hypothetical protein
MTDEAKGELAIRGPTQIATTVDSFSEGLTTYLEEYGLPSQSLLVPVPERRKVFNNLPSIVGDLSAEYRSEALYISKFAAACAAGLFDAALNYLWDETVSNLRKKIARFDLDYFFDSVVTDPKRRSQLKIEDDLVKLEDWELAKGCFDTGLITTIGYKHLSYIRDMRNYASAAHPNQNELTGLQIVSWLETCIREVLSKEPAGAAITVRKLLNSLRTEILSASDVPPIAKSLEDIADDLVRSLLRTVFGMYTDTQTAASVRNNILLIAPAVWSVSTDDARFEIGLKYASFSANAEVQRKALAHGFLQGVEGLSYLPEDTRTLQIEECLDNLWTAHNGYDNFYNEPPHARLLKALIPASGEIPRSVAVKYVRVLLLARVGNGYGVSWAAEPIYDELIARFQQRQINALLALLADDLDVISRLQLGSCSDRGRTLAKQMIPRTANPATKQALEYIGAFSGDLSRLSADSSYTRVLATALPERSKSRKKRP